MAKDICPQCGETEVTTLSVPDRKIKLSPLSNKSIEGDKVKCNCGFCGWWSEGTYTKTAPPPLIHKCGYPCKNGCVHDPTKEAYQPGPGWVWKTASPLSQKKRERLTQRLKKIKKMRGRRGFK